MKTSYIDTDDALVDFLDRHADETLFAVDTEFVRENTYYPILALIQIAAGDEIVLVSPLKAALKPLGELFADPNRFKILHSGSQDMEVLFQFFGVMPQGIIDTQIAASLLGMGEQIGYGALVQRLCGVELEKSYSRFDWTKRPLPPKVQQYAAEDVRYLHDMWQKLKSSLKEKQRLEWLWEEQRHLVDEATYTIDPMKIHTKVKGIGKLKGAKRKVANSLARVREECASEYDLPRRWIIPDEVILDLARRKPTKTGEIISARGFPKRAHRFAEKILDAIQTPLETSPEPPRKAPLTKAQDAIADVISLVVKICAEQNEISAKNLASKREIEKIVRGKRDLPIFQNWRNEVVGTQIEAVLNGAPIRLVDGKLHIDNK